MRHHLTWSSAQRAFELSKLAARAYFAGAYKTPSESALERLHKCGELPPIAKFAPSELTDALRALERLAVVDVSAMSGPLRRHWRVVRNHCHEFVLWRRRRHFYDPSVIVTDIVPTELGIAPVKLGKARGTNLGAEEDEFPVDEIRAQRKRGNVTEYLVHWSGYDTEDDTWEPSGNVRGSQQLEDFLCGR